MHLVTVGVHKESTFHLQFRFSGNSIS